MKKILSLLFLLSFETSAAAENFTISSVALIQLCGAAGRGEPNFCNCHGTPFSNHGEFYCTPYGLQPMHGTHVPVLCPARVSNGLTSPNDGRCGSKLTYTDRFAPQRWGLADFSAWGCIRHDDCYAQCGVWQGSCDDELWNNLTRGCGWGRQAESDPNHWAAVAREKTCYAVANAFYAVLRSGGEGSYRDSQARLCQCGRDDSRQDGCNGAATYCLYWGQPGCPGFEGNPIIIPPLNPGLPLPLPPGFGGL